MPGGQILSKRQTVFFTSVDPMKKEHKDPDTIDLKTPRLAWYKQKTWKKHQNMLYWVDIKLAQKKGLKIERHHPSRHTPSLLYPEGYHDGNWRNQIRESICVTPASSEDFLEK